VPDQELPYTIISDGKLLPENLRLAGREQVWLDRCLKRAGVSPEQVLLLTVTRSGKTCLIPRRK
jgi:uncharacterized membrane protein YcaP (DUF421 family)